MGIVMNFFPVFFSFTFSFNMLRVQIALGDFQMLNHPFTPGVAPLYYDTLLDL